MNQRSINHFLLNRTCSVIQNIEQRDGKVRYCFSFKFVHQINGVYNLLQKIFWYIFSTIALK